MEESLREQNTDAATFQEVALPHLDALFGMAYSLTKNKAQAEDLVQEACLKAFRSFHSFQPGTNIKAWLFTILRNLFISDYRKKVKAPEQSLDDDTAQFSFYHQWAIKAETDPTGVPRLEEIDESKLEEVLGDEIMGALETLPEEFREAIYLCDVQGLSYNEIAGILEIPIGTVRSRLARARGALQKLLWGYAHEKGLFRGPAS